jgi:hypothetical protein
MYHLHTGCSRSRTGNRENQSPCSTRGYLICTSLPRTNRTGLTQPGETTRFFSKISRWPQVTSGSIGQQTNVMWADDLVTRWSHACGWGTRWCHTMNHLKSSSSPLSEVCCLPNEASPPAAVHFSSHALLFMTLANVPLIGFIHSRD